MDNLYLKIYAVVVFVIGGLLLLIKYVPGLPISEILGWVFAIFAVLAGSAIIASWIYLIWEAIQK